MANHSSDVSFLLCKAILDRRFPPGEKLHVDLARDDLFGEVGISPEGQVTCPLKTNPNLERESKDSGVCKEAGNDEEAIHERTDYPQAEGSRS